MHALFSCSFLFLNIPPFFKKKAFLNDVVGLKMDLAQSSLIHANGRYHFTNALNMWSVLNPQKIPKCDGLLSTMTSLQKKFADLDFLERCEDQVDFDELSRKLESYYDEGWKSRGWEVLYKREGNEARKKGRGDCFVVKEEHLDEGKKIGRKFIETVGREDLVPLLRYKRSIPVVREPLKREREREAGFFVINKLN